MPVLKLINEGDEHTMDVSRCEVVSGDYGPQVLFSDGTNDLYLPQASADRQLTRMGTNYAAVVGMTLRFSRDHNPKKGAKPFWGINYAGVDAAEGQPSSAVVVPKKSEAAPTPSSSVNLHQRRDAVVAQYLMLWDAVAMHLAQTSKKYGYGLDAAAIQAATATVWISWDNHGIQPSGLTEAKPVEKPPTVQMPAPSGRRLPPPEVSVPPANPNDDNLPF